MADPAPAAPAGAITSDSMKPAGAQQAADKAAATTGEGNVMVRPVASYLCSATGKHRSPGGDAYAVASARAADLFAGGLVEYDRAEDETRAVEVKAKAAADAVRATRAQRQGSAQ